MCDRMIGRFRCCSVVQGDCLELLREIPAGAIDCVCTDPPYGVKFDTSYTRFTNGLGSRADRQSVHDDDKPFDPSPWLGFKRVVMFGANCFSERLPIGSWLIWDKRFANGTAFLADGEAAWMNHGHGVYICSVTSQGFIRPEPIEHPTQKPVEVMQWCIEKAGMPTTILDPYCGSGSTLVAAKRLGLHSLGFEISADYCAIAQRRLDEIDAQPMLFERAAPEQMHLER